MSLEKSGGLIVSEPIFSENREAETGRLILTATIDLPRSEKKFGYDADLLRDCHRNLHGAAQDCFGSDVGIHLEYDPETLGDRNPFAKIELVSSTDPADKSAKARLRAILRLVMTSSAALVAWDLSMGKSLKMCKDVESILSGKRKGRDADRSRILEPDSDSDQTVIVESDDDHGRDSGVGYETRRALKRKKFYGCN